MTTLSERHRATGAPGLAYGCCRRPGIWLSSRNLRNPLRRVDHGRSEKESLALAPQDAPLASRAEFACLYRMSQLRRAEAAASSLPVLRPLP